MKHPPKWLEVEERSKFCRIDENYVVLMPDLENEATAYEIDLDRIKEPLDLVSWVLQLCEKSWMDNQRIEIFCLVVASHKNWGPLTV
jgi:hypothetical protein